MNIGEASTVEDTTEKQTKGRRCLGIGCFEILSNGDYFCPKCKAIKDRTRLSGVEHKAAMGGRKGSRHVVNKPEVSPKSAN